MVPVTWIVSLVATFHNASVRICAAYGSASLGMRHECGTVEAPNILLLLNLMQFICFAFLGCEFINHDSCSCVAKDVFAFW